MCGITGIVGPEPSEELLWRMTDILAHRGPDDSGVHIGEGIGLGSRRLSIIDLSPAGHMPMSNEDGTVWIVHNGEVYNYLELREQLGSYDFKSQTDTEVVLHAYEEWGESCVERFIGMFAFAIWDDRNKKLFCARDQLGIKPFYYYEDGSRFIFASEIKSLMVAGIPRKPNDRIIYDYLFYGYYEHSEETFFEGVNQLLPGHYLVLENGRLKTSCYWDVANIREKISGLTDEQCAARFHELLVDAVKLHLRSDVPVGVNLSGGLDSPSLVYTVNQLIGDTGNLQTFSMAFEDPKYDERIHIEKLVPLLNCRSNYSYLQPEEVFEDAEKALWHQEQPYGGVPTIAYWKMNELAKEKEVTVLLEGQGVDEMLGGYRYFHGALLLDLFFSLKWAQLVRELCNTMRLNGFNLSGLFKYVSNVIKAYYDYGSQDSSNFLKRNCLTEEFRSRFNQRLDWPKPFKSRLSNMMYRDIRYTKLPRVLRFNDRMSMAFSRELRVPFLDRRLVELAFALPDSQKIRGGEGKIVLRNAMRGSLPDDLVDKSKQAVTSPQQDWFRNVLADGLYEILDSESFARRKYFNVAEVKREFNEYRSNDRGQNSFFIWQWVNLELWFRMFIDKNPLSEVVTGKGRTDDGR